MATDNIETHFIFENNVKVFLFPKESYNLQLRLP